MLNSDPREFRNLRKKFYRRLHKIAWESKIGWICRSDADINILSDVMEEFEKLTGNKRVIEIIDVYLPRETVQVWLNDYISHLQEKVKQLKPEDKQKLKELTRELELLEQELKAFSSL